MLTFSRNVDGYYDVADQMIHDLRRRAEEHFRRQEREKARLNSIRAFEAHRARVRRHFLDAIGGLPTKRTPLRARVTGRTERPASTVERLIYESLPDFPVTANCYVPKGLRRRTPAVVFVCGHWDAGKMQETYQSVCIDLANNGFIVLAVDPLGQGERSQYFEHGQRVVGSSTVEHTHAGLRQACVNWFRKHLAGMKPNFKTVPVDLIPEKDLWATTAGQVAVDFPRARTVFDLNRDLLRDPRPVAPRRLRETLDRVLGIPHGGDRNAPIHPRIIADEPVAGRRVQKIFFFSAPDMVVTGLMLHPPGTPARKRLPTTLLLLENGTADVTKERLRLESLLRQGQRVFVFDPRGVGAVKGRILGDYEEGPLQIFNTEYKLGCDAAMLGISTLGLRVFDVLRAYDYLKTRADVGMIHVHGVGSGAVFAWFAAAAERGFASLTVEEMVASYRRFCLTRYYDQDCHGLKGMAWGMLRHFDLMDLLPLFRGRAVTILRPRDADGSVLSAGDFRRTVLDRSLAGLGRARRRSLPSRLRLE